MRTIATSLTDDRLTAYTQAHKFFAYPLNLRVTAALLLIQKPVSTSELGECFGLHLNHVNEKVKKLQKMGYLIRVAKLPGKGQARRYLFNEKHRATVTAILSLAYAPAGKLLSLTIVRQDLERLKSLSL